MEMFTEPSGFLLLQQLEELKFIRVKSRRTLENGDQQVEYMKFDE